MNGDTQIYVSGREYKVPGNLVTYEQVVKIWNELHEPEDKHIIGTPGIDYDDDLKGEDGVPCLRMPASTNRSIARLVAWNDRPIKSDAVVAVSRGASGNARMSSSAAEPRRTVPSRSRQESWSARSCSSKRPSTNGWIVSNCGWAMAACATAGRESSLQNSARSNTHLLPFVGRHSTNLPQNSS